MDAEGIGTSFKGNAGSSSMATIQHDAHSEVTEVLDPVCGMTISPADAVGQVDHAGRTYYFCSENCMKRFSGDPAAFLGSGGAATPTQAPAAVTYVCPMDPEVRQSWPGACPKCGMALEPDLSSAPAMRVEYTCPMHPQIVRAEPGAC